MFSHSDSLLAISPALFHTSYTSYTSVLFRGLRGKQQVLILDREYSISNLHIYVNLMTQTCRHMGNDLIEMYRNRNKMHICHQQSRLLFSKTFSKTYFTIACTLCHFSFVLCRLYIGNGLIDYKFHSNISTGKSKMGHMLTLHCTTHTIKVADPY